MSNLDFFLYCFNMSLYMTVNYFETVESMFNCFMRRCIFNLGLSIDALLNLLFPMFRFSQNSWFCLMPCICIAILVDPVVMMSNYV